MTDKFITPEKYGTNQEKFTDKECLVVFSSIEHFLAGPKGGRILGLGRHADLKDEENAEKYRATLSEYESHLANLKEYIASASEQGLAKLARKISKTLYQDAETPLEGFETRYSKDGLRDALLEAISYRAENIRNKVEAVQQNTDFMALQARNEKDAEGKKNLKDLQELIGNSGDFGGIVKAVLEKNMLDPENQKYVKIKIKIARKGIEKFSKILSEMSDGGIIELAQNTYGCKNYNSAHNPLERWADQTPGELRTNILQELYAQVESIEGKYNEIKKTQTALKLDRNGLVKKLPTQEKERAIDVLTKYDPQIYEKNSEIKAEQDKLFELLSKAIEYSGLDGKEKRELLTEVAQLGEFVDAQKQTTSLAKLLSENGVDVTRTYEGILAELSDNILICEEKVSSKVSSLSDKEKLPEQTEAEEGMAVVPMSVIGLFLNENLQAPTNGFFETMGSLARHGVYIAPGAKKPIIVSHDNNGVEVPYRNEEGIKMSEEIKDTLLSALSKDARYTAGIIMAPEQKISDLWKQMREEFVAPAIDHADRVFGFKPQTQNAVPGIELIQQGYEFATPPGFEIPGTHHDYKIEDFAMINRLGEP